MSVLRLQPSIRRRLVRSRLARRTRWDRWRRLGHVGRKRFAGAIPLGLLLVLPWAAICRGATFAAAESWFVQVLVLLAIVAMFGRAFGLEGAMREGGLVPPMALVPMSDGALFRRIYPARARAAWLGVYWFGCLFGALACLGGDSSWLLAAISLAVLQVLVCEAIAVAMVAWLPAHWFRKLRFHVLAASLLSIAAILFWPESFVPWFAPMIDFSLLAVPTSWPIGAWFYFHSNLGGVLLALALSTLAILPLGLIDLGRRYRVREILLPANSTAHLVLEGDPHYFLETEEGDTATTATSGQEASRTSPQQRRRIRERLEAGVIARRDWPSVGWIEGVVRRWLTPRERLIACLLFGTPATLGQGWTRAWRRAHVWLAFWLAATFLPLWPNSLGWLPYLGAAVCTLIAMPVLGGHIELSSDGEENGHVAVFRLLPISTAEFRRTIWKCNLIRCLAWLPTACAAGAALAWHQGEELREGILLAARIWWLLVCLQLPAIAALHATQTRGPSWSLVNLLVAAGSMVLVATAIGAGIAWFLFESPYDLLAGAVLACSGRAAWTLHQFWFERNRVEILLRE